MGEDSSLLVEIPYYFFFFFFLYDISLFLFPWRNILTVSSRISLILPSFFPLKFKKTSAFR